MRQKTTPVTRVLNTRSEEKLIKFRNLQNRKIQCSTRFHNFRQVEAANEFADFLACTGTCAKKIDQKFFLEHLMYQSIPSLTIPPPPRFVCSMCMSGFRTFFLPGGWGTRPFNKIHRGFSREGDGQPWN